jgi:anti-sigma-K factor RskA
MLRSLRYQNPNVRDHLASQYAMGLLTFQVKRRVEKLMQQDPSFEQEVFSWQERLSPLNDLAAPKPAPDFVKQKVMARIQGTTTVEQEPRSSIRTWWQNLRLWQGLATASFALLLVLAIQPFVANPDNGGQLSYLAVMQSALTGGEAPLVISAYAKSESQPSRLELRWNDRTESQELDQATLWAVERETGNVTQLISLASSTRSIDLNAAQWQAVKNSLELIVVKGSDLNGEVLLRGTCLQLADWQKV